MVMTLRGELLRAGGVPVSSLLVQGALERAVPLLHLRHMALHSMAALQLWQPLQCLGQ